MTKIAKIAMAALTILMTSSAFAEASLRPYPGRWRCERAEAELRQAEQAYQLATLQLSQANQICGGAPACILAAQNHYNETLTILQIAQRRYNRWCY